MSRTLSMRLPQAIWAALVDFDLYTTGPHLRADVRERLLRAPEDHQDPPAAAFRVVALTLEEADQLEEWLAAISDREDAPRACRTALELVREAKRLRG